MKTFLGSQQIRLVSGGSRLRKLSRGSSPLWSRVGADWYARQDGVELNTWTGVAFGNGVFVAVSQDGTNRIMTSVDGARWTARSAPSVNSWSGVLYANNVFLAYGGPKTMTSADGKDWQEASFSGVQFIRSIAYGGGRFVGFFVSTGGTTYTTRHSTDGLTWTTAGSAITSPGSPPQLQYALGKFFTTGGTTQANGNGSSANIWSTDGLAWNAFPLTAPSNARSISSGRVIEKDGYCYGASQAGNSPSFFRTTDGESWEQISTIGGSLNAGSFVFFDGLFAVSERSSSAVSRVRIWTSPDCINWTPSSDSPRDIAAESVAYGNGVAVAVGGSGASRVMSSSVYPELAIQASQLQRVIAGQGEAEVTLLDARYSRYSSATVVTDYALSVRFGSAVASDVSFSSSNQSVLSPPDSRGVCSWVSNGTSTITATDARGLVATAVLRGETRQQGAVDAFIAYNSGTAARSACDAVDLGISGGGQKAIFSTKDHSTQTYVRNTSCWIHGRHDLTPLSVWNSSSGSAQCGTLISPRHVLWAAHYPLPVGTTLRWVKQDGTVVSGTITAKAKPAGSSVYYPDFEVGLLSADIGSGVSFARVLPEDWKSKLPSLSYKSPIPVCVMDQDENALVADWFSDGSQYINCQPPASSARLAYFENLVTGDSGHPCFLLLNGVQLPVLLTVWTYGGAGSGTSVASHRGIINSLMSQLGGGYQLTPTDLSGFPSY